MKKNFLIITIIFISSMMTILAQEKKITRQEYYMPIREADEKMQNLSRREKVILKVYSDDVLESTYTKIEEFILPNKRRFFSVQENNGKQEKLEVIKIGNKFFRKVNEESWTKEEEWSGSLGLLTIPVPIRSEYSVEETKINNEMVKLYKSYDVFKGFNSKDNESLMFSEQKVWIDKRGLEIKQELSEGILDSQKLNWFRLFEYEYNPKDLKIEAPIINRQVKK